MSITSFRGEHLFLSNFYPHSMEYEGIQYPTVEHAFQAAKVHDKNIKLDLAKIRGPKMVKAAGLKVPLRSDWETVKNDIMFDCLKVKFTDESLGKKLKDTGSLKIVEGNNWHDNYWGDCICDKCSTKTGKNVLGDLLEKVRDEI